MAELFKNMWNEPFFDGFTKALKYVLGDFDGQLFLSQVIDDEWENKTFSQRGSHIPAVLKNFLPADYKKAIVKILELIRYVKETPYWKSVSGTPFGLSMEYGVLAGFVQQYGSDDYDTSVAAIEEITQFTSCEFAVRPFIIKYPDQMMKQMLVWSEHGHWAVRRLASEGCRPRLPWAMALPELKRNPTPILPVLENLKDDVSRIVRKSVANNLNDIAKDHPRTVIDLTKKWQGKSENTDWIIKHGCRTLLKQGHAEALEIFGLNTVENISVQDFRLLTPKVNTGNELVFTFKLLNNNKGKVRIRLEYGLYYRKANGTLSRKVCKISEKEYAGNSVTQIARKQSFRLITTRTFHPGLHQVSVIINGNEFEKHDFELVE